MTLKNQAFHWLVSASQSVAHSQISDKASPGFSSLIVQQLDRYQTNWGHNKEKQKHDQEKIWKLICVPLQNWWQPRQEVMMLVPQN